MRGADADIVARAPRMPKAADQVFFEIKTGVYADIRPNQGYIYSLALVGDHVLSDHPLLGTVGLSSAMPLPAMDFLFVDAVPPELPRFSIVYASMVNRGKSLAQVMATVAGVRGTP